MWIVNWEISFFKPCNAGNTLWINLLFKQPLLRKPAMEAAHLRIWNSYKGFALLESCKCNHSLDTHSHWRGVPHKDLKSYFLLLQTGLQNLMFAVQKTDHAQRKTSDCHRLSNITSLFILFLHQSLPISCLSTLCISAERQRPLFVL